MKHPNQSSFLKRNWRVGAFTIWWVCIILILIKMEQWPFHPRQSEFTGRLEALPDYLASSDFPMDYGKFYFTSDDGRRYALADDLIESVINLDGEETLGESRPRGYSIEPEHRYHLRGIERGLEKVLSKMKHPKVKEHFIKHIEADHFIKVTAMRQLD